jgi:hypothetical protein
MMKHSNQTKKPNASKVEVGCTSALSSSTVHQPKEPTEMINLETTDEFHKEG